MPCCNATGVDCGLRTETAPDIHSRRVIDFWLDLQLGSSLQVTDHGLHERQQASPR